MTVYKTIADLPVADAATADDLVEISQAGRSKRASVGQIAIAQNGTVDVAAFPGADMGEKLNNCLAALPPATGGICDARSLVGAQTAAATIVIPPYATVLLGKVTLVCSGNPAITYSSFCSLIGAGRARTIIQSGVANSRIVQSDNTTLQRFSFTLQDLALQQTSPTGMVSLNLERTSSSRIVNCLFQGSSNAGTGIAVTVYGSDAASPGCYYNQFTQCDAFTASVGFDIAHNANSNLFVGCRTNACATGVRFGNSGIADQNVFYDPAIEASTVDNVVFGVSSMGNTICNPRLESPGVPYVSNLSGALWSIVRDAYIAAGTAAVDPAGTLTFTTDRDTNTETRTTVFATPTQTTATSALSITGGWNNAGVIFNGVQINITDSASDPNSNLFNVLRSSSTQFRVGRTGNVIATGSFIGWAGTAIPAGGTSGAGLRLSSTANFGVFFGSGAPNKQAAKGSLYLRSDGTTTNDRMYVNTDGATAWTAVTTAT